MTTIEATMDTSTYQGALRRVIKTRMNRAAINLNTLAWGASMRQDYLSHVLSGKRSVTTLTLVKLAAALDTTAGELHKEARALCD